MASSSIAFQLCLKKDKTTLFVSGNKIRLQVPSIGWLIEKECIIRLHSTNSKLWVLHNTSAANNTRYFFQENFRYDKTVPNFVLKHIRIESFKVTPHKRKRGREITWANRWKVLYFCCSSPLTWVQSDIDSHIIKAVEETMLIGLNVKGWCVFWGVGVGYTRQTVKSF